MDKVKEAREAIRAYQAGEEGAAERLIGTLHREGAGIFGPVIINAARVFANRHLAESLSRGATRTPLEVDRIRRLAFNRAAGGACPNIDKHKFEELKTDMGIRLLEELRNCHVDDIRDPFRWAKTVLRNYGCDLANKEKKEYRIFPPKPAWEKKSGDHMDDVVETASSDQYLGHEMLQADESEEPKSRSGKPFVPPKNLELLYYRAFPSEEFRTSVEMSLEVIDMIYMVKSNLVDPRTIPGKFSRALKLMRRAEKQMSSIFGRGSWNRVISDMEAEVNAASGAGEANAQDSVQGESRLSSNRSWRDRQGNPNIYDNNGFRSLVHYFASAKMTIEHESRVSIPPALLFALGWKGEDGEDHFPDLSLINVTPSRMIFDVWKRAPELRQKLRRTWLEELPVYHRMREDLKGFFMGEQLNLNKLKLLFFCQKGIAAGTHRQLLFEKIRDESDFENLRKYQYRSPRRKGGAETYGWIVDSVYVRCFKMPDVPLNRPY